jgi:hypothetical protein
VIAIFRYDYLIRTFSRRLVRNSGAKKHLNATISPKREQEARVTAWVLGISFSGAGLTIIGWSAPLDS